MMRSGRRCCSLVKHMLGFSSTTAASVKALRVSKPAEVLQASRKALKQIEVLGTATMGNAISTVANFVCEAAEVVREVAKKASIVVCKVVACCAKEFIAGWKFLDKQVKNLIKDAFKQLIGPVVEWLCDTVGGEAKRAKNVIVAAVNCAFDILEGVTSGVFCLIKEVILFGIKEVRDLGEEMINKVQDWVSIIFDPIIEGLSTVGNVSTILGWIGLICPLILPFIPFISGASGVAVSLCTAWLAYKKIKEL